MTVKEYNAAVDEYADALYRFVLKNINDKDASKDILQDVFEKVWLKRDGIEFEKVKSYLFTAAYRTMLDAIKKAKKHDPGPEKSASRFGYESEEVDLAEVLEKALNRLPEQQKAVILLRDYEGYSYEEIGEITGLSESQVKVYIYRGRMALKNYLVDLNLVI